MAKNNINEKNEVNKLLNKLMKEIEETKQIIPFTYYLLFNL